MGFLKCHAGSDQVGLFRDIRLVRIIVIILFQQDDARQQEDTHTQHNRGWDEDTAHQNPIENIITVIILHSFSAHHCRHTWWRSRHPEKKRWGR
jgi:hypothetical protein